MLPSKNRLSLSKNKTNLLAGKRVESDQFRLIARREKGIFKTATVVSKKVAARAVDRNRIRRLITEAINTNLGEIKFQGFLIVIAKQNIAEFKKNQIESKILKLIEKL